ncbi:hypothetical protein EJ07DRAFT_152820 [Lizonia empirigonia]|nr:hypothetical protein EJ07DRAFT_152820 [Lizonia empirigonia]
MCLKRGRPAPGPTYEDELGQKLESSLSLDIIWLAGYALFEGQTLGLAENPHDIDVPLKNPQKKITRPARSLDTHRSEQCPEASTECEDAAVEPFSGTPPVPWKLSEARIGALYPHTSDGIINTTTDGPVRLRNEPDLLSAAICPEISETVTLEKASAQAAGLPAYVNPRDKPNPVIFCHLGEETPDREFFKPKHNFLEHMPRRRFRKEVCEIVLLQPDIETDISQIRTRTKSQVTMKPPGVWTDPSAMLFMVGSDRLDAQYRALTVLAGSCWTRIDYSLVSAEALEQAREPFEEDEAFVLVPRKLTSKEVLDLVNLTEKLLNERKRTREERVPLRKFLCDNCGLTFRTKGQRQYGAVRTAFGDT